MLYHLGLLLSSGSVSSPLECMAGTCPDMTTVYGHDAGPALPHTWPCPFDIKPNHVSRPANMSLKQSETYILRNMY